MPDSAVKTPLPPHEVVTVDADADEVCCDGGDGALGHPRVWYSLDGRDHARCHYCDRSFIKKSAHS